MKPIAYATLALLVSCGQIDSEVKVGAYRSLHKIMPNPQLLHEVEVKANHLHSIGKKILQGKFSVALATEYSNLLTTMNSDIEQVESDFWWAQKQTHKLRDKNRHHNLYYRNSRQHLGEWLKEVKYTFVSDIDDVIASLGRVTKSEYSNKLNLHDRKKLTTLLSEIKLSGHNAREQIDHLTNPLGSSMLEAAENLVALTKELSALTKELDILTKKRDARIIRSIQAILQMMINNTRAGKTSTTSPSK